MKKNKTIAAILFGVLSAVQFFGLTYVLASPLAQMPSMIFIEIITLVIYIIACAKFFYSADQAFTMGEKRASAALCVIYFVAIGLNSNMFSQLLGLSFMSISQEFATKPGTGIAFLVLRTLLLFVTICFVILNEKEKVASIEFDTVVEPKDLVSEQAVEEIITKLDDAEV